jgi:BirA family transcriptional regulator, biotin operon repressor / biotin---[acetyl-CoA-carboxylase] ligase
MLQFADINCNNILILSTIDSTNNYAQSIVNTTSQHHNTIIQALHQSAGRGQRNNSWHSQADINLMMSIIIEHQQSQLQSQFILNMAICLGIADAIDTVVASKKCSVKWSNDIYINDKKIAGVLIENNIRGSNWTTSIIGIGININQLQFDNNQANATSIFAETGVVTSVDLFRNKLIESINVQLNIAKKNPVDILKNYNAILYKTNEWQLFSTQNNTKKFCIQSVNEMGQLIVNNGQADVAFSYGEIKQIIGDVV